MFTQLLDSFFQSFFMQLDTWSAHIKQSLAQLYLKQTRNISFFSRIACMMQLLVWTVVCAIFIPIYLLSTLVKMVAYVSCAVFFGICAIAGMLSVLWGIVVNACSQKKEMAPYSTYTLWAWVALGRGKCSLQDFLYGREAHATPNVYFRSPDIMYLLATGHINMSDINDEIMKRFENPGITYHRGKKNISVQQVLKASEGFLTIFAQEVSADCLDHLVDNKAIDVSELFCQDTVWYACITDKYLKKAHEDNLISYQEWVGAQQGLRPLLMKYFECYYSDDNSDKKYDDFFEEFRCTPNAGSFVFPRVIRLSIAQRLYPNSKDIASIHSDSKNDIVLSELGVEPHSSLATQLSPKHLEYYQKNSTHLMFLCVDDAKRERCIMLQDTTILDRPVLFHLYLFGLLMMDKYGKLSEDLKNNIEKFYFIHNALTDEASIQHKHTQDRCDVHLKDIPGVLLSVLTSQDSFVLKNIKKYPTLKSYSPIYSIVQYPIIHALGKTNILQMPKNNHNSMFDYNLFSNTDDNNDKSLCELAHKTYDMLSSCSNIRILALDYPECINSVLSMPDETIEKLHTWMKQHVAKQSIQNNDMLFLNYLRIHKIVLNIGMTVEEFLSQTDPVKALYEYIVKYANDDNTPTGVWKYSVDNEKLVPLHLEVLEKIFALYYEDARVRVWFYYGVHASFFYNVFNGILESSKAYLPIHSKYIVEVTHTAPNSDVDELTDFTNIMASCGSLVSESPTSPQNSSDVSIYTRLIGFPSPRSPIQSSPQNGSCLSIYTGLFDSQSPRSPTQLFRKSTCKNKVLVSSHKKKSNSKSNTPNNTVPLSTRSKYIDGVIHGSKENSDGANLANIENIVAFCGFLGTPLSSQSFSQENISENIIYPNSHERKHDTENDSLDGNREYLNMIARGL